MKYNKIVMVIFGRSSKKETEWRRNEIDPSFNEGEGDIILVK